jgi:hypothetical protein
VPNSIPPEKEVLSAILSLISVFMVEDNLGYDGESEVTTPYDSCVLIMPSLRQTPGASAVRFGKFIDAKA